MTPWQETLKVAVAAFIDQTAAGKLHSSHLSGTPERVARAFAEMVRGYEEDPADYLKVVFNDTCSEMIHVQDIEIVSRCAHHLEAIVGLAHFAYIPKDGRVVGLSKIPRFIRVLSGRLQVQENLTSEITEVFMKQVDPAGCAVHIVAEHHCMKVRGVREHSAVTRTTNLAGNFKKDGATRDEFLQAVYAGPARTK